MALRNILYDERQHESIELAIAAERRRVRAAQMQPISPVFERLQLSAYIDVFVENGFDTWEDVLDITESDLYVGRSLWMNQLTTMQRVPQCPSWPPPAFTARDCRLHRTFY